MLVYFLLPRKIRDNKQIMKTSLAIDPTSVGIIAPVSNIMILKIEKAKKIININFTITPPLDMKSIFYLSLFLTSK
jgi:hypothetical protein